MCAGTCPWQPLCTMLNPWSYELDPSLRIELMESASGTFFDHGSPRLNGDGRRLLVTLAQEFE
jgi:hypothetical protein